MEPLLDTAAYLVEPESPVDLKSWAPDDDGGDLDRDAAKDRTKALRARIEELQELIYAEGRHRVLIVLQATDTAGKDSTIRRVFDGVNPQGVSVASFKKPTEVELAHDYLWRVHAETPGAGQITIFNRSHYEDVLVVRVHELVPEEQWSRRYQHIRHFEQLLADEGTTIIKFFLHISKDEQAERLQARLDDPAKHWKFAKGDLAERELWPEYQAAFTAMLERTSAAHAPWYVIPANRKWFRDLLVSQIVVDTLEALNPQFPDAEDDLDDVTIV